MKRAGRAPSQVAGGPQGLRKAGCYKTLKKKQPLSSVPGLAEELAVPAGLTPSQGRAAPSGPVGRVILTQVFL